VIFFPFAIGSLLQTRCHAQFDDDALVVVLFEPLANLRPQRRMRLFAQRDPQVASRKPEISSVRAADQFNQWQARAGIHYDIKVRYHIENRRCDALGTLSRPRNG
jgi:hypothetical protein